MNYWSWIFIAVYALLTLGTVITVLMDNRQPAKAIAWILVLTFLPIVGLILYIFFGQNTRKEKLINQKSLDELTKRSMLGFAEQKNLTFPERYHTLIQQFIGQNLALPFKDNSVDIYTSGYDYFLALLQAVGRARHHIHISTYIIEDDPLGRLVADALIDRVQQGVEVRLIYDDVGCWRVPSAFFERMRRAGVRVQPFMPVRFPALTSRINYRNHRKLCIIDGQEAFIGGMNIALRYVKGIQKRGAKNIPWRDTHLRVCGGVVRAIQRAFLVDWYFVDSALISGEIYYPAPIIPQPSDAVVQLVTSSPVGEWPVMMQGYTRILLQARDYVYMETPYFLPTDSILLAMRTAAQSGVDVRLMVPSKTDTRVVERASRSYLKEVVESGVQIFLYDAGFNHSKLLVSDDSLCTCGSTNIDFRSFEHNFEANLFFYDCAVARRFKQVFLDDLKHCRPIEEALKVNHPFLHRLWESILRLFSPLL